MNDDEKKETAPKQESASDLKQKDSLGASVLSVPCQSTWYEGLTREQAMVTMWNMASELHYVAKTARAVLTINNKLIGNLTELKRYLSAPTTIRTLNDNPKILARETKALCDEFEKNLEYLRGKAPRYIEIAKTIAPGTRSPFAFYMMHRLLEENEEMSVQDAEKEFIERRSMILNKKADESKITANLLLSLEDEESSRIALSCYDLYLVIARRCIDSADKVLK